MADPGTNYLQLWTIFCLIMLYGKPSHIAAAEGSDSDEKVYIVYMGELPAQGRGDSHITAASLHHNMLESVLESNEAVQKALLYSYGKSFNGFATRLSSTHLQQISNMDGVVSVFENRKLNLMTTRSWDFVGLTPPAQGNNLEFQSDVIVGIIDTGIWPESESFSDAGFDPVPSTWRGVCQTAPDFTSCNKKVVGARVYHIGHDTPPEGEGEYFSPRDSAGHGTHTSSTAAGNIVRNVSLYGIAQGDARGGVPGARIAMYKACSDYGCSDADILAAFDDAIYDGVDVISVSLGSPNSSDYFEDSIAIGAFHAMKRGILTSNAAGNSGPYLGTLVNYSPWSFTIAASTIDRRMEAAVLLGNGMSFQGLSINTFTMEKDSYPLIYGRDAANVSGGFTSEESSKCVKNSLDSKKVQGKIVLCSDYGADEVVYLSGGVGVIIMSDGLKDTAFPWLIPASKISTAQGDFIKSYLNSTSSPVAKILKTSTPSDIPAPVVASFSSRGPSNITIDILKPDITAPGVDIIAAWSKNASMTELAEDTRFPDYNIISGTSISCPHVSGAAAFVKSYHPDWSPAAIKSALMTTAFVMDATLPGNNKAEFGYGAGQIDPMKAVNPGLVYDADEASYVNMLCSQGYNETSLRLVSADFSGCPHNIPKHGVWALNYPSIMAVSSPGKAFSAIFPRTVTNVGPAESIYKAIVNAPSGVNVTVEPDTLSFTAVKQKLSYNVTIEFGIIPKDTFLSGALTWSSGNYSVRSPVVVYCEELR